MICKNCGTQLEDTLQYCTACGAKQEQEKEPRSAPEIQIHFCGRCGSPITDTLDKYCTPCRAKEEKAAEAAKVAEATQAEVEVKATTEAEDIQPVPAEPIQEIVPEIVPEPQPTPTEHEVDTGTEASEEQEIPKYIEKAGRTPKIIAALLLVVILCELVYYLFSAGGMEKIREAMAPAQGGVPQSVTSQSASQSVSVPPITLPTPEPEPLPPPVPTSAYVFEDWDSIIAEKRLKYSPESVTFLPMEGTAELYEFNDGIAIAKTGEKMGFIRDIAKGVEDARYDQIMPFSENKAAVCLEGKWGYVDSSLSVDQSIACEWDSAVAFSEGYAVVSRGGKEFLIDQWGTVIIGNDSYTKLRSYSQGLLPVQQNGKWGYIDIEERVVIPFDYDDAGSFSSGLAVVVTGGKAYYIDTRGNQVTGLYDDAWGFNENHTAKVKSGEKYGLISGDGGTLILPEWDNIWNLQEGVATVQKNGKFGYVSQSDNVVVVQPVYSDVWSSTFGLIPVKTETGKWGYVDRVGNTAIEPQYDDAYIFADGVARVGKGGKYCLIDLTGKELCDYSYKQMGYVRGGYCPAVTTDGQWGYIKITYK